MPSGFPVPKRFRGFRRLWLPQHTRVRTPPARDREKEHTDRGEPNVAILQTLFPMVVEGRSVEQRIYHVDMSEVEVYQLFGEVWRREAISD